MSRPSATAKAPLAALRVLEYLGARASEKQQISIWIFDDEGLSSPGFFPERLKERNARRLEFEEQLLDLFMRLDAHVGGQQALFVSECGVHHGIVDGLQIEQPLVSLDLSVKGWLAVDKDDGEAELPAPGELDHAAPQVLAVSPSAMQRRYLDTSHDIAAEKNATTMVFPFPIELLQTAAAMAPEAGS
jgi:hypothetical protein